MRGVPAARARGATAAVVAALTAIAAIAAVAAGALTLGGCGGIIAPDLFVVTRTGATPQARLTLVVNEEGMVRCNGGQARRVSDPQLIQARTIQERLHDYAVKHESLPPARGSVLSYSVRDPDGTVAFADNSAHQPHVMRELALWTLTVAQGVCRLPQGAA